MNYDVIIIGAGSAGLPAGMYASRYNLKNLIIGSMFGGALATSHKVENYPGTLSASGKHIMDNFRKHAEESGSEFLQDTVARVEKNDNLFLIKTVSGKEFNSRFVVYATGNKYKKVGFKGEEEFLGKGVSYCATCDAMFFKNRDVAIIGGGNTALTEALFLSDICRKVYLIHRRDTFRAESVRVEKIKNTENIELVLNEEVESVSGSMFMEEIYLKSGKILKADGIFVAVGNEPDTKIIDCMAPKKDEDGCLIVDQRQETSIAGLYAAGDVTTNSNKFRQTIMSAAEGCLAANSIHEDIVRLGHKK
ncbi:MAG: FAD-dependent oxidoreductase [Candidatus Gracilibacteria bacterium]|nr:FAD-dependent oxidoreductase [Candidatus Gracilibacteria bacterium]